MSEPTTDIEQMRLKHSQDQEVWNLLDEVERLRSRLGAISEIAEGPVNDFETPLGRLDRILRLAQQNGRTAQ